MGELQKYINAPRPVKVRVLQEREETFELSNRFPNELCRGVAKAAVKRRWVDGLKDLDLMDREISRQKKIFIFSCFFEMNLKLTIQRNCNC